MRRINIGKIARAICPAIAGVIVLASFAVAASADDYEFDEFDLIEELDMPYSRPCLDVAADDGSIYIVSFCFPNGVYSKLARSTDGGESWTYTGVPGDIRNSFPSISVLDSDSLYLASGGDTVGCPIYRTDDAGSTWTKIGQPSNGGRALDAKLWINASENPDAPADEDIHLIYCSDVEGIWDKYRIYYQVSHDGGASWTPAVKTENIKSSYPRILIGEGKIFAFYMNITEPPHLTEYIVSEDWGATWSPVRTLFSDVPLFENPECIMTIRTTYFDEEKGLMALSTGDSDENHGLIGYFWYENETFQLVKRYDITELTNYPPHSPTFNAVLSPQDGKVHCAFSYYPDADFVYYANDLFPSAAPTAAMQVIDGEHWKEKVFDGSDSSDDDGIVSYLWDFGDGSVSTQEIVIHKYRIPGEYVVTLTVWDEYDLSSTVTETVTVRPPNYPTA